MTTRVLQWKKNVNIAFQKGIGSLIVRRNVTKANCYPLDERNLLKLHIEVKKKKR